MRLLTIVVILMGSVVARCDEPSSGQDRTASDLKPADPQTIEFVRRIVLLLLPSTFDDEKNWGAEKRIQSGLHMNMDGLQLKTRRKWNHVNHGSWQRASGHLVDPKTT